MQQAQVSEGGLQCVIANIHGMELHCLFVLVGLQSLINLRASRWKDQPAADSLLATAYGSSISTSAQGSAA